MATRTSAARQRTVAWAFPLALLVLVLLIEVARLTA